MVYIIHIVDNSVYNAKNIANNIIYYVNNLVYNDSKQYCLQ